MIRLPYFDLLLDKLQEGDPEFLLAFDRHVHWGCWDRPEDADGSIEDFAEAAELLCRRVCDSGAVSDGMSVLDVGCGFGGTIASLNERFSGLELVGLNLDARQLERAREQVRSRADNRIRFQEGDACRLPFPDSSFDRVLAVECIFHFPSRELFFREARRVLRPGGVLALSDFVPPPAALPLLGAVGLYLFLTRITQRTYGPSHIGFTVGNYSALAKKTGFVLKENRDITPQTLPTYPVIRRLMSRFISLSREMEKANKALEMASRLKLLKYRILSFET